MKRLTSNRPGFQMFALSNEDESRQLGFWRLGNNNSRHFLRHSALYRRQRTLGFGTRHFSLFIIHDRDPKDRDSEGGA